MATIRAARLANFVTATDAGVLATPLPLDLDESEGEREAPWAVSDAPGKRKMGQNRPLGDRTNVAAGLAQSAPPSEREAARLVPAD